MPSRLTFICPGWGDQRGHRALHDAADRDAVERDRCGQRVAVRGLHVDEYFTNSIGRPAALAAS